MECGVWCVHNSSHRAQTEGYHKIFSDWTLTTSPSFLRCSLSNCVVILTATECTCCAEIFQTSDTVSADEVGCIIIHPGCQGIYLEPWVLIFLTR